MAQRALDQEQRLAEVQSLTQEQLEILRAVMQNPVGQRKVVQHFDVHREEFQGIEIDGLEIDSAAAYQQLFRRHVQRTDLRVFTYISSKGRRPRMWIFVAMDNGVVSLYNET